MPALRNKHYDSKYEKAQKQNFINKIGKHGSETLDIKRKPTLRIWTDEIIKTSNKTSHFQSSRHVANFYKRIDETLNFETPAGLDHHIKVTRGQKQKHRLAVERVLTVLQKAF